MRPTLISASMLILTGFLALAQPAHAYLSYTLAAELKRPLCTADSDGDCLDNGKEQDLAWIVAPHYFYDEDESCSGKNNAYHYSRKDFYQVRPEGTGIQDWSSSDGRAKWVTITYFLLHPHDCQSYFFGYAGGHQGDSEHVRYWLFSYDLRTWYLFNGRYWHHDTSHDFSGTYLEARAREIGSIYPSVAADEDGHGSWPGKEGRSSHCAGSEDNICYFGTCDCFVGTMHNAFIKGYWEWVGASSNVGGPLPETWNSKVLTVVGKDAYSIIDVGHGTKNREYWTTKSPYYQKFCGWECSKRTSSGNCSIFSSAHGHSTCSSPLSEKVNPYNFSIYATSAPLERNKSSNVLAIQSTNKLTTADTAAISALSAETIDTDINASITHNIPGLALRPAAEQLETLAWMLTAPQGKIVAALPQLRNARHLSHFKKKQLAHEQILKLVDNLEKARIYSTAPSSSFVPASISGPDVPLPETLPPSLLEEYHPHPSDSHAVELQMPGGR